MQIHVMLYFLTMVRSIGTFIHTFVRERIDHTETKAIRSTTVGIEYRGGFLNNAIGIYSSELSQIYDTTDQFEDFLENRLNLTDPSGKQCVYRGDFKGVFKTRHVREVRKQSTAKRFMKIIRNTGKGKFYGILGKLRLEYDKDDKRKGKYVFDYYFPTIELSTLE